jgi:hypothetical protein
MSSKTFMSLILPVFAAALMLSVTAEDASAIPAFARKYRMSCKTCHTPIPRLKPYGDDFAGNGFQLPDQDAPRYYVDTGDEELSLIRDFPIAVRLEGHIGYVESPEKKSDFESPYILKLLSGGAISDHMAYYFYFLMDERGEVAGVEDAYIMYNNAFGADLDFYLGQFQISDPLFKRELRLTLEDYQIYKLGVGNSQKNLAYGRGAMVTLGLESGTDLIFEVVNGNGLDEADASHTFDSDKYKDLFFRISQDFNDYFRLGGFYFVGWERSLGLRNRTWMAGPDLTISAPDEKFQFNFQYLLRKDDDPLFTGPGADELETKGVIAEAVIAPNGDDSRHYFVLLYNWIDSDIDALDYNSFTGHISYLARRNVRLVAEVTREFEYETTRLGVGFVSAF